MLRFSDDPQAADKQMRAVIFYLTTFGYIDGDFDQSEKAFVRDYISKLVASRVEGAVDEPALQKELIGKYTTHFLEVFELIDRQVRELFTESVAEGENQTDFVHSKLKLRCFEIFKSFGKEDQDQLMNTVDELIAADGQVHPAEQKFRSELATLLIEDPGIELLEDENAIRHARVSLVEAHPVPTIEDHPFFGRVETHYSASPYKLATQVKADRALLDRVIGIWDEQRKKGKGKLAGHKAFAEFAGQDPFLDDHVYVFPDKPGAAHDITVLGDLHGCYSVLKAAILQADFLDKVNAYNADPSLPRPSLVLLGDYIDRGMFSYQGVLRTVLQLFATVPDHVYVLRGNHEYYVEFKGTIYGGVKPAEAINTLKPHVSPEVFQHYSKLFEAMPSMLAFDRTLFVHAGIPRDSLIKERWKDLSTLNDPDIRFQMMWSDPSSADVIPAALQEQSARFPFGRLQSQAFLQRIGCNTLIRGHEKIEEGFRRTYDDPEQLLITLFSSGGKTNDDLPPESGYRSVTPMALTIKHKDGQSEIIPWRVDYERYNDPARNAFFKVAPEIEHRVD